MKSLKKIAGYNILAILVYSILVRAFSQRAELVVLIYSACLVALHVFVCVILSLMYFADRNREVGRAWLSAAGIVLLVGFSVCLGNTML